MSDSTINIDQLTHNQPFCAGVVLCANHSIMVTLNTDGLPKSFEKGEWWRVGGIGGGQEPGETIIQCARREANEEICSDVELVSSPISFFHDIDTGEVKQITCADRMAPLLLERMRNPNPDKPYRPDLPTGPYIYFGLYLAKPLLANLQPGDDVEGLLTMPLSLWHLLEQGPTVQEVLAQGAYVIWRSPRTEESRLWLAPNESFRVVARLLIDHPHLLSYTQ